jgi:hypothetical protein
MDELSEDEKQQGAWRGASEQLEVEITQRLNRLKGDNVLRTPRQLEDWLSGLKDRLFLKLGVDPTNQTPGRWLGAK